MTENMKEIAKIEIAARKLGISYGQYVQHYLTPNLANEAPVGKYIRKYSLQGVLLQEYSTITEASEDSRISMRALEKALYGEQKTTGGFQWRYAYDPTPLDRSEFICQYTGDGVLISKFGCITEAERITGTKNISRAISRKIKANGYYWRRER